MRRGAAIILALAMLGAVPFARADEADDSENFFSENPPPADESEDFFGDAPAAASGFQSSGRLEGELWQKFAFDTRDNGHDELLNTSLSVAKAEGTFNLSPAFSVRLGALATYDLSWNEDEEVGRYRPDLWEAYATYRLGPVDFYAGHKIWAWGLMDLISPTDMINPIDLSRVFDIEMNLFKLPVASGGAAWYLGDFRLEGVVLPFFRASRFEIVGSDTALLGHRFPFYDVVRTLDDEKGYRQVARFLDRWFPNWQDRLQEELDDPDLYATHFEDMEDDFTSAGGAVRFGGSKGGWDFDLMGYYLWDQTPTIYINPKLRDLLDELRETPEGYRPIPDPRDLPASMLTDPFAAVYHRVYGPGFDVGTTFGSFGVRVEGDRDLQPANLPQGFDARCEARLHLRGECRI
ncbi:MAG: hypothetical protein M5R36_05365 [Deltaproteobacteria bacterium]|nr:hypothetical protein [Deltaproteobacteria bacterium]